MNTNMNAYREIINEFMVSCFYSILEEEQQALETITNGKLTIKEIHLIEAVFRTQKTGTNTFTNIASILRVALGTLTKAFIKLQSKGFLTKERDKTDKRIFYILPTKLAGIINDKHIEWHEKLMDSVIRNIPERDIENFIDAIKNLSETFKKKTLYENKS